MLLKPFFKIFHTTTPLSECNEAVAAESAKTETRESYFLIWKELLLLAQWGDFRLSPADLINSLFRLNMVVKSKSPPRDTNPCWLSVQLELIRASSQSTCMCICAHVYNKCVYEVQSCFCSVRIMVVILQPRGCFHICKDSLHRQRVYSSTTTGRICYDKKSSISFQVKVKLN